MSYLSLGLQPPLAVIYEDQSLIAINKPAGQLFHGYTRGLPSPLVDQVKEYIRVSRQKEAGVYLGVVHRLDRPVSGLSLFARNSKAAARIAQQFQARSLDKIYLAIVEGSPSAAHAELEDELAPLPNDKEDAAEGTQRCTLSYRLLAQSDELGPLRSLLAIRLGSGRRHQIRRQLSARGWPIVGDQEYGAVSLVAESQAIDPRFRPIALHAAALRLEHPATFDQLLIQAPPPFYWSLCGAQLARATALYLEAASGSDL